MQRYFVENQSIQNEIVTITGDDVKHIAKVMRMNEGDKIICCNESAQAAICEIEEITNAHITARIVEWVKESSELPVKVTIVQGLPKGDKLDYVMQKGTELGAVAFQPFSAKRSVVKWDAAKVSKKTARLQKIVKEAAEQSHRSIVPKVMDVISLKELLLLSESYDYKLVAYEEEAKAGEVKKLAQVLQNMKQGETVLAVFGPEGGLSEEEVDQLTKNGFTSCSLGPRILRAETAPLYLLSAVSYQTELLG
ncbi:16S rRNA (uracil(1498)-N(3))-methyltransferase [Lottiidibacillus patelloidae]|uniref:Ribosomal RNA small subunit methyltransferase E n=1 Tax=Lottiidibacillus patelloidae TaxID=2670334 RepID=A0A263BWR1_9BACI|nr:16S rRNA (uracil(1498)-N(3))-methyltransferase [Lottiidibacillus patelloidae]OZM58002.1 16S rRNA (uracil(1498)-N(3))-methyltransferase [Lottiidibacillus patelloidae]